jgi:hypothetical protein
MRLLRLSLLDTTLDGLEQAKRSEGIYLLLTSGRETIAIGALSIPLLQTVVDYSVRLLAQGAELANGIYVKGPQRQC